MIEAVLLALLLAELGWLFFHRSPAPQRERRFRTWSGRAWLRYGLVSLLVLIVLGRVGALWTVPGEFAGMADVVGSAPGDHRLMATYAAGMAGGMAIADAVAVWRRGRRRWLPDYSQLEARPGERGWAGVLALTAGLVEEPFFRLVLPLLLTRVGGNAAAAFGVSIVLFGLAHRYQGWKGVLLTMLSGGVLSVVYIQTGSLIFTALVHAAIDANLLVLQPMLVRSVSRRHDAKERRLRSQDRRL